MRISDWSSDVCSSDLPALHRRPRQPTVEPALDVREAVEADDLARLIESDQVAHPAEQRDVGDAVAFVHHPVAARQPVVEHAQQPRRFGRVAVARPLVLRSEEHTYELQSLMRISYAAFCLKKTKYNNEH